MKTLHSTDDDDDDDGDGDDENIMIDDEPASNNHSTGMYDVDCRSKHTSVIDRWLTIIEYLFLVF